MIRFHLILVLLFGSQEDNARVRLRERVRACVAALEVVRDADPEGQGPTGAAGSGRDYYHRPKGPCTGTLIDADGWIATSYFNVSGTIRKITVTTSDRRRHPAELKGYDVPQDVAFLKVEASGFSVPSVADPVNLSQGTFCAVMGCAPDPDVPTLTWGVLSALHRFKDSAVQTDAEMNYGNVGGPLVDVEGRVIGIANHIRPTEAWGQSGGIGFAVKMDRVASLLERLKRGEKVAIAKIIEPWLGIVAGDGVGEVEGIEVGQVIPGHGAERAGIKVGDVIVEFNDQAVTEIEEFQKLVSAKRIGDKVRVAVLRKNEGARYEKVTLTVTLTEKP